MPFSGLDFYNRLNELCVKNGTTITSFLISTGKSQSAGTYMKKKAAPDAKLVSLAAKRFGVATEWLLGLTDNPLPLSQGQQYVLDDEEAMLIDNLRSTSPATRETVLKMAAAALSPAPASAAAPQTPIFSSPKDDIVHRDAPKRKRPLPLKRVEGRAAAGMPLTAVPEDDRSVHAPPKYGADRYFIVQAAGDSMIGAGIEDGDFCVFDSEAYQDEGRIMHVRLEGSTEQRDTTIKRVYFHPGADPDGNDATIELRSENPAYPPMFYPARDAEATGVLVAVIHADDIA